MVTGRRAFSGHLPSRVIDAILHGPLVSPRAVDSRISPGLERIILKCLDRDPENRYQSAKELLVDFRRLAAPFSTSAVAPGPAPPLWRRVLTPTVLGIAALLALAVTLTALNVSGLRDCLMGPARLPQIHSFAMLPLENLFHDPEPEEFPGGMPAC